METFAKHGSQNSLVRPAITLSAFEPLRNANSSVFQTPNQHRLLGYGVCLPSTCAQVNTVGVKVLRRWSLEIILA